MGRRPLGLGLVVVALLALPVPADAVLSGRNGRIAFTSGREGANDNEAQLYLRGVIGSTGGGALSAPFSIPGTQNRHASWSPDRTKIVFAAGTPGTPQTEQYDLFIKDFEANTITPLDTPQVLDNLSSDHPAWSPDGTRIAYEQQPTDNSDERDIMVKTFGTAAPAVNLTTGPPIEFKAAWSPDSQEIYYAKRTALPAPNLDIVKKAAGGGVEVPVAAASGVDEYQPSISPDGSKICFTLQSTPGNTGTADIYTAGLPGLTDLTKLSDDDTKGDINCTWSPNGAFIAYSNGVFGGARLVMERSDNSELVPTQLEDDVGSNNFDGNADWAPDGSPDCPDTAVTTTQDTPLTINLECTDTGPLYERTDPNGFVTTSPTNGTTSDHSPLTTPSTVKYTPNAGFAGTDTLEYGSFDDFGFGTDKGTVTITVNAPTGGNGGGGGATIGDGGAGGSGGGGAGGGGGGGGAGGDGGGAAPPKCAGVTATIVGTAGADAIVGTARRDVIVALGGNDKVRGGRGADLICGGDGRDRISGGPGNDTLSGGAGKDRLSGNAGNDTLSGNGGNDSLSGGLGRDKLSGGAGRDKLSGGAARDVCNGGPGRDRTARC